MVCTGEKKWQELKRSKVELKRSKNEQNARAPGRHFDSAAALRDVGENNSSLETAAPSPAPQPSTPAITSAAAPKAQHLTSLSQRYKSSAAALLQKFGPYTSKFVRKRGKAQILAENYPRI